MKAFQIQSDVRYLTKQGFTYLVIEIFRDEEYEFRVIYRVLSPKKFRGKICETTREDFAGRVVKQVDHAPEK